MKPSSTRDVNALSKRKYFVNKRCLHFLLIYCNPSLASEAHSFLREPPSFSLRIILQKLFAFRNRKCQRLGICVAILPN